MVYPINAIERRRRRRRWLLAILVALIGVSAIVLAVRYRTEERGVADYLAVAEEVALTEAQAAADLEAMFSSLSDIDRPEVLHRLENLAAITSDAAATLGDAEVVPAAAEVHGYLLVAAKSWNNAVQGLDEAIVQVLDEAEEGGGDVAFQDAFDLLAVGDVAYAEFLDAVDRVEDELVTRDFDMVAFADAGHAVASDPEAIAVRLRSTYKLGERRDVSVTALTDPEPVGDRNNVPLVPHSATFSVQAVVANEGNEVEEQVAVVLDLVPSDGGDDATTIRQTLAALEPGQARTLVFDSITLRPGGLYELVVSTTVDDDADVDNDSWRMVFYRNENV